MKVLFTSTTTVILQEVELTCGYTRFKVRQIALPDWKLWFIEWIDEEHDRYSDAVYCWERGMGMYGANVG